jgi:hypothetical protein
MSSYFHLDFDTTAPEITWGAVTGVGRNRIVIARYTVSEPGVIAAEFIDFNGDITDLEVQSDKIIGRIPANAAYGEGSIRAWLQDDVGNTSVRSLAITIRPANTHIVLDTTPPVITWGTPTGTNAGELLQIPYTINEPFLLSAKVRDYGGTDIPLTIHPDRLEALLPVDLADGPALVSADVEDDVGNSATRTMVIMLGGAIVVPQPGLLPSMPTRKAVVRPRIITDRSTAHFVSSYVQGQTIFDESRVRARDDWFAATPVLVVERRSRSTVYADATYAIFNKQTTVTASHARSTEVAIKRVDGLEQEEELLLLTI